VLEVDVADALTGLGTTVVTVWKNAVRWKTVSFIGLWIGCSSHTNFLLWCYSEAVAWK
jgi:hypothetical protein